MTAVDAFQDHQFKYNPAFLNFNKTNYDLIALDLSRSTRVVGSPDGNRQDISYARKDKTLAVGAMFPIGGGSVGVSYISTSERLETDNSVLSRILEESKQDSIYAMKFSLELSPQINFGFHYQYKQNDNSILGSFFTSDDDRTSYKAFISSYRIGLSYKFNNCLAGAYTAPAGRGRSLIDGEYKIVAESGSGGLEVSCQKSSSLQWGVAATRWFFRRDDRLELSTSPVNQRNISLNGVELDQYLFPIQNIRLSVKKKINKIWLLLNLAQQEAVFHFNEEGLPGDDRENVPSFKYLRMMVAASLKRNNLNLQLAYLISERSQGSIIDNTSKLGHRTYSDYNLSDKSILFSLSFKK